MTTEPRLSFVHADDVPWTEVIAQLKWTCLLIQAICVLIAIALSHGDERAAGLVAMGLFATGAAACFLLIGAYDRPFVGQFSIPPSPLLQVMPEVSGPR